ncbi:MAG: hypothetical protein PHY08_11065 [Candidatus Cloacimonetes bacterium]|nr:hypothetical protein [Candidatus Cloacimonadota bacterium]
MKDNFLENTFGANYTLRFDNISFNVPKSGSVDVVIKTSMPNTPENNTTGTFKFLANAFRGRDGKALDQYAPATAITGTATQTLSDASTGTLTISLNANSPKTGFAVGNKTATSSNNTLSIFDFKAENRDVTVKTLKVTVADHATTANQLVSAVKLYDGSTLLSSAAYAVETADNTNGDTEGDDDDLVATFSNLSILIAKDTTKTLTVKVDFKPIDGSTVAEGLVVNAGLDTNPTAITAVDSNDDMLTQAHFNSKSNDNIDGKSITAYTKAPKLAFVSSNISKTVQSGQDDQADATIVFDVTAEGGDIYFKKSNTLATITIDDGMTTHNNFSAAGDSDKGVGTYTFTSTAESYDENTYLIRSGQTARVTISGHISIVGTTGYTRMALDTFI